MSAEGEGAYIDFLVQQEIAGQLKRIADALAVLAGRTREHVIREYSRLEERAVWYRDYPPDHPHWDGYRDALRDTEREMALFEHAHPWLKDC